MARKTKAEIKLELEEKRIKENLNKTPKLIKTEIDPTIICREDGKITISVSELQKLNPSATITIRATHNKSRYDRISGNYYDDVCDSTIELEYNSFRFETLVEVGSRIEKAKTEKIELEEKKKLLLEKKKKAEQRKKDILAKKKEEEKEKLKKRLEELENGK